MVRIHYLIFTPSFEVLATERYWELITDVFHIDERTGTGMAVLVLLGAVVFLPLTIGIVTLDIATRDWSSNDDTFWIAVVSTISILGFVLPYLLSDVTYHLSERIAESIFGLEEVTRNAVIRDVTTVCIGVIGCLLAGGSYAIGSRYGPRAHTGTTDRTRPAVSTGFGGETSFQSAIGLALVVNIIVLGSLGGITGQPLYQMAAYLVGSCVGILIAFYLVWTVRGVET